MNDKKKNRSDLFDDQHFASFYFQDILSHKLTHSTVIQCKLYANLSTRKSLSLRKDRSQIGTLVD